MGRGAEHELVVAVFFVGVHPMPAEVLDVHCRSSGSDLTPPTVEGRLHAGHLLGGEHAHRVIVDVIHVAGGLPGGGPLAI